ncbi:MAG: lysine--tRNA ligase, partial [Gemmatimonadales bacterium]
MSAIEERSYVEAARREKRAALEAAGIAPFAYRYERSHTTHEALAAYQEGESEGPRVRVAGRIAAFRPQGKTTFAHLEDGFGRIQVYFRQDELSDVYELVKLLDLDDYVGVEGPLFRTKRGEISVRAAQVTLLAKSLRPLPRGKTQVGDDGQTVTYGGLQDPEIRYRQRYADLAVHSEVRDLFVLRAKAVTWLRRFLDERGFLEVETPVLQPLYGGATARPFVTHHRTLDQPLYLRIADELYLKRLLVGGLERVYEIGHDFRNEGMDRTHNPEFTMLELYQAYADYGDMLSLAEAMFAGVIEHCLGSTRIERGGVTLDFTPPLRRVGFIEAARERCGLDLRTATEPEMRDRLLRAGASPDLVPMLAGGKLQDEIFKVFVEPHLVQPTFVLDHPKALSPLAKEHRHDPHLTERFELFVAGSELANAFSELNDPDDQRHRFEDQARQRRGGDEEAQQFDADFIRALEYGMPPAG